MSVKLKIHPLLLQSTGGQEIVDVRGQTVGECLRDFQTRFPGAGIFYKDKKDKLRNFVGVFLNHRSIYPQGLDHPVRDGDELLLLIVVGGG